jgi:Flp pilus assembly protein TadD
LSIQPDDAGAQTSLGNALVQKRALHEATEHYQAALRSAPGSVLPLNNLAWILSTSPEATLRNGARAVELAKEANQLSQNNNPIFVRTLAAALGEAGQFENAISTAESAARLANAQGQPALARQITEDVDLYRRQLPLRDQSLTNAPKNR